jgi:hypothetical protein
VARDWALFLHLVGVLLFVGSSVSVTALRLLTIGKDRPPRRAPCCCAPSARSSPELARRLRDPVALTLDASMLVGTLAIVALMVWRP